MTSKCTICGENSRQLYGEMFDDRYGCDISCTLWECEACGHVITYPRLNESELPSLYEQHYSRSAIDLEELASNVVSSLGPGTYFINWLKGLNHLGHTEQKKINWY